MSLASSPQLPEPGRKKILFVAEAVTLAHVGRAIALAQALDPALFEVHFACADGYDFCFTDCKFTRWTIKSIPSQQFLAALAQGKPVYDAATLSGYVEEDLELLAQVRPDVVVGDFRLSLSVSARIAKVPYVALINAYWSPHVAQRYRVPNIPLTRFLPIGLATMLFRTVRPVAFALHSRPLNGVRRRHRLPPLGFDLRRVYTDADHTLYADVAELFPPRRLPSNHSYLGPVIWSPPIPTPDWWDSLPADKPIVYVTLGSSGQGRLLPLVLEALSSLPVTVIAATAGNVDLASIPANAHVASFLPGEAAARRAALVICNGGSPTCHQALVAGVPVLGIASNLDQFLNMDGVIAAGAGKLLRADRLSSKQVRIAAQALLGDPTAAAAARGIARTFSQYDPAARFKSILKEVFAQKAG
jgi:UDP:flavonoid glycosyltransferase YjiC (YdhE family)